MAITNQKKVAKIKRIKRIRKKVIGTTETPRLRVFRSSKHIYAQIIDDSTGNTLSSACSMSQDLDTNDVKDKKDIAHRVGLLVATKAKSKGIEKVVFDRGGNIYHGRVKSLSEGAREGGLTF